MHEKTRVKLGHSSGSPSRKLWMTWACLCCVSYPVLIVDDLDNAAVFVLHGGRRHWLFRLHRLCCFLLQLLLEDAKLFSSHTLRQGQFTYYIPSLMQESATCVSFLSSDLAMACISCTLDWKKALWNHRSDQMREHFHTYEKYHGLDMTSDGQRIGIYKTLLEFFKSSIHHDGARLVRQRMYSPWRCCTFYHEIMQSSFKVPVKSLKTRSVIRCVDVFSTETGTQGVLTYWVPLPLLK